MTPSLVDVIKSGVCQSWSSDKVALDDDEEESSVSGAEGPTGEELTVSRSECTLSCKVELMNPFSLFGLTENWSTG
jgi:hypothetical protein